MELFGTAVALPDFPVLKSLRGLGLSDEGLCAELLAEKFDYRNTFYHQAPFFDLTRISPGEQGLYDFVVASEILEHVPPPVEPVFSGISAMLKPHGFLLITVPYSLDAATRENYPELKDYKVISIGDQLALVNRTASGAWQVFDNLVFHGGLGSTLELRLFSEAELTSQLSQAGCHRIRYVSEDYVPFGIVHEGAWGAPVVAGREPFRLPRESVAELITSQVQERSRFQNERQHLTTVCLEMKGHCETLDKDLKERERWALTLDQEVSANHREIERLNTHLEELRGWGRAEAQEIKRLAAEIERLNSSQETERQQLIAEIERLRHCLDMWEASRWSHLGRWLGYGPKFS